jgi:hypothetical protein
MVWKSGISFLYDIGENDTVYGLKKKLERDLDINAQIQTLVFCRVLPNSAILSKEITSNANLTADNVMTVHTVVLAQDNMETKQAMLFSFCEFLGAPGLSVESRKEGQTSKCWDLRVSGSSQWKEWNVSPSLIYPPATLTGLCCCTRKRDNGSRENNTVRFCLFYFSIFLIFLFSFFSSPTFSVLLGSERRRSQ